MKVKWTHSKSETPQFIHDGYKYFLDDTWDGEEIFCITRWPAVWPKHHKCKSLEEIWIALIGHPYESWGGRNPSEQYKEEVYADLLVGRTWARGSLRSYTDKYPHKYAIDLSAKEYWEYFDLERVSPRFSKQQEAKKWFDHWITKKMEEVNDSGRNDEATRTD